MDLRLVRGPHQSDGRARFLACLLDDAQELHLLAPRRGSGYHGIRHFHQGKDKSSSSIHCERYNHTIGTGKTHVQAVSGAASQFHVYACEWTADGFTFYIDGKAHHTFANDKKGDYATWPFSNPFYLKLNLAWGGNMGGSRDESKLPAVYEIDYVRVFQKD